MSEDLWVINSLVAEVSNACLYEQKSLVDRRPICCERAYIVTAAQ